MKAVAIAAALLAGFAGWLYREAGAPGPTPAVVTAAPRPAPVAAPAAGLAPPTPLAAAPAPPPPLTGDEQAFLIPP